MSAARDGGPAFPSTCVNDGDRNITAPDGQIVPPNNAAFMQGMTLRDYFAAKAMQAEMITTFSDATPEAAEEFVTAANVAGRSVEDHLAFNAYLVADAMLRARRS